MISSSRILSRSSLARHTQHSRLSTTATAAAAAPAVHEVAATGFDKHVGDYDSARPSYPHGIVDTLLAATLPAPTTTSTTTPSDGATTVVEIGAGTGKFTRLLVDKRPDVSVVAVEPVKNMRARLSENIPTVSVVDGSATALPLPDHSASAVYAAQAFHWFATTEAITEFHRVLKPGGSVGLIWNLEDREVPGREWVGAIRDEYERYEAGTPQFRLGLWRAVLETLEFAELFEPPVFHEPYKYMLPNQTRELIWQRALSKSYISCLNDDEKAALKERIFASLHKHCTDFREGSETTDYPYQTHAVSFIAKSA